MLTLKWVMRDAEGETPDGPVLQSDQIVRDAARVVLDHHGPCRVVDGDKLVGIVDDEDILRVVVAEEEATHDHLDAPARRPPAGTAAASKEEQPVVEYGKNRHTGVRLLAILVVWVVVYVVLKGTNTLALAVPGHHRPAPEVQRGPRLGPARGPGQLVLRRRARRRSATSSTPWSSSSRS